MISTKLNQKSRKMNLSFVTTTKTIKVLLLKPLTTTNFSK